MGIHFLFQAVFSQAAFRFRTPKSNDSDSDSDDDSSDTKGLPGNCAFLLKSQKEEGNAIRAC